MVIPTLIITFVEFRSVDEVMPREDVGFEWCAGDRWYGCAIDLEVFSLESFAG